MKTNKNEAMKVLGPGSKVRICAGYLQGKTGAIADMPSDDALAQHIIDGTLPVAIEDNSLGKPRTVQYAVSTQFLQPIF